MFINVRKVNFFKITGMILCGFWLLSSVAIAEEFKVNSHSQLNIKPAKCITLHKGRRCFAQLKIRWHAVTKGNYCLFKHADKKSLKCWRNSQGEQWLFEFESSKEIAFELRAQNNNALLASAKVEVNWVHKSSPKKKRWRVF